MFFHQHRARVSVLALFLIVCTGSLRGAPQRYGYSDDTSTAIREMRDSIDALRHEVNNHESEIHMVEERSGNLESTLASMRQMLLDSTQANKEMLKGSSSNVDNKLSGIESINKGIVADIGQLKTHANDSSTVLGQYKQRIADLEKIVAQQTQNIEHLQSALKSLTEALGGTSDPSGKTYRVKSGDSLEKIARANGTTIKALKETNHLTHDRIVIGQTLQLP